MESVVLDRRSKKSVGGSATEAPLLKLLREKKKISRTKISKLTQLSTYQVEGLEGKNTQNQIDKIILYIRALGYKVDGVLSLMESGFHETEAKFPRGVLGKPKSETSFQDGVKLLTYLQEKGNFFGQLQLAVGKSMARECFPISDVVLGIVREGTLVIDTFVKQTVHKKDHFFVFPGYLPAEFINGDSFTQASALLFSVKYPH